MIWLVWRRQRVALLFAIGLAALVTVVTGVGRFVAVGIGSDRGVLPCLRGVRVAPCDTSVWWDYLSGVSASLSWTTVAMLVLPTVCGIIAGAGLFGRGLERGTHLFALSQSTSRLRWGATGLLVAGLPVAAAVAVAGVVAALAVRPFGNLTGDSLIEPGRFLATGVLPAAYTLLAFGLAAVAGLLLRNALAAVAVAAVLQLLVLGALGLGARSGYLPADVILTPVAATDEHSERLRTLLAEGAVLTDHGYVDAQGREIEPIEVARMDCSPLGYTACLLSRGVTAEYVRYQPESRYWPFQAIEGGIVLALLAGSLGVGLWGLRRRVH